jgi:hypothetical protein
MLLMEENVTENKEMPSPKKKDERPEVIILRNWREYLGESLLIIFSVTLAIILTEVLTKVHENQQAREILHQLREELKANKDAEELQYHYHLHVLKNIDSALADPGFAKKFLDNNEMDLYPLAPNGAMIRELNDVAWQIAKQNNVFSKIDLSVYSLLVDTYNNQQRTTNAEAEIGKLLLSYESRKQENLRTTLILLRDNYHAWAVGRAPALIEEYKKAIDALSNY